MSAPTVIPRPSRRTQPEERRTWAAKTPAGRREAQMKPGIVFLFLAAAIWVPRTSGAQNPGGQQPAPSAPAQPAAQAPAKQPAQPPAAEPEEGAPLNKLGLSDDQKRQIHGFRKKAQQQVQA